MRILKFIGAFLGTLLIILLLSFGYNFDAVVTLFQNSGDLQEGQEWVPKTSSLKGLTEYIGSNPEHVSLVSRSTENPDTTISYGAEKPRTMGTLSNFFLITTYARMVESGAINPDSLVSLDPIDRYQLPYIDASNHDDAVSVLSDQGYITDDNRAPLEQLIKKAIIYNDLAISDFLFEKIGSTEIDSTYSLLNIESTDKPLPFSGLYISLHPSLSDSSFDYHFSQLKKLHASEFRKKVLDNTREYLSDDQFHKRVNKIFNEEQGLGIGFAERRDILELFPKSTAKEFARLMVELNQDSLISPDISQRVKEIMSWPYKQQSLNSDFEYYGAIYDNRLGLLNGIDYGASVYSKEPFGQAVFFDSLQVAFWFHMSSNLMHQDYQQRLMWDPALRTTTLRQFDK